MKKNTRIKLAVFGVLLVIIGYFCVRSSQALVPLNEVEELGLTDNSEGVAKQRGSYLWNVSAYFAEGDIICGRLTEPQYKTPGWLNCLEPVNPFDPRYGKINLPNIFVYLELLSEDMELISKVEMVWVNDPNAKPPMRDHLYIYNMSYIFENSTTSDYYPVETVPGTIWIVLTPDGAPCNGTYTLRVRAFGSAIPPQNNPPTHIALGKRLLDYPFSYLLPLGVFSAIVGVVLIFTGSFPKIIERKGRQKKRKVSLLLKRKRFRS